MNCANLKRSGDYSAEQCHRDQQMLAELHEKYQLLTQDKGANFVCTLLMLILAATFCGLLDVWLIKSSCSQDYGPSSSTSEKESILSIALKGSVIFKVGMCFILHMYTHYMYLYYVVYVSVYLLF